MTVTITITVDPPDEALENRDPADWTAGYLAGLAVAHGLIVRHSGVRLWPDHPPAHDPVECPVPVVFQAGGRLVGADSQAAPTVGSERHSGDPVPPGGVLVIPEAPLQVPPAAPEPAAPTQAPAEPEPELLLAEGGPVEQPAAVSKSHRSRQRKAAASRTSVAPTGRLCSACGATTAECRDTPAGANCCPDCTNPLHRARRTGSGS